MYDNPDSNSGKLIFCLVESGIQESLGFPYMGRPKPASLSFRASFILDEINYKFKRRKKQLYQQLPGKRGNLA